MLNSTKTWQEELWDRFKSPLGYSSIDNKNNSMYDLEKFITELIAKTREETIREEIAYWIDVFDNRPKDRDLESDNIAQNFARIEIKRLENKLKK